MHSVSPLALSSKKRELFETRSEPSAITCKAYALALAPSVRCVQYPNTMKYVHQLQQQQQSLYRWNNKKLFLLILIAAIKFHSISSFLLAAATPTSTTTKRTTTMDEEEESAPTTTELYKPYRKYPELFGNTFKEEWLHPTMIQLVKEFKRHDLNETTSTDTSNDTKDEEFISRITVSSGSDTSLLLLKKEMEDVYSFDCFTEEFIRMFNEELHNFYHISEIHNIPVLRPNSSKFVCLA